MSHQKHQGTISSFFYNKRLKLRLKKRLDAVKRVYVIGDGEVGASEAAAASVEDVVAKFDDFKNGKSSKGDPEMGRNGTTFRKGSVTSSFGR